MKELIFSSSFFYPFLLMFVCLAFGYTLSRGGRVRQGGKEILQAVIWNLALPCLSFTAFMQDISLADIQRGAWVLTSSLLLYLGFIYLGKAVFRSVGQSKAAVASLMGAIGQVTLFTLPLLSAMERTDAVFFCGLITLPFRFVLYFLAYPMILSEKNFKVRIKKALLTPVMIAMILGLVCWLCQNALVVGNVRVLRLDESASAVYAVMKLLASTVCPLAMILVGLILGETKVSDAFRDPLAWGASLLRSVVCPLVVFGIVSIFPGIFDSEARLALVLGFAAPASVTICTFAMAAGKEERLASRITALSTVLSLFTIPILTVLTVS